MEGDHGSSKKMYTRLAASLVASLVTMYFLAFSQIDQPSNFQWSLSVFWVSLSMISTMGLIMLMMMRSALTNRRTNLALAVGFSLLLVGSFAASRTEAGVGDDAFLRSMVPHHSRAIHMCNHASLADPQIIALCGEIVQSQTREIDEMKQIEARRGG